MGYFHPQEYVEIHQLNTISTLLGVHHLSLILATAPQRQGANPNVVIEDAGNRTALHMAAYDAHVEAFRTARGLMAVWVFQWYYRRFIALPSRC